MKRIICIILCLLLLAGCGSNAAPGENEDFPLVVVDGEAVPSGASLENTASEAADGAGYLTYASQALPAGIERVTAQCKAGDRLYVGGLTRDGAALAWTDLEGTEQALDLPEEIEYISALCPTADGFALLGGSLPGYYENWHGDSLRVEEPEGAMWIIRYDQSGAETGSVALQEAYPSAFLQMLAAENSFYLLSEGKIVQTGPDGAELGQWTPPENNYFLGMAQCEDELYVLSTSFFPDVPNQILKLDAGNLEPLLELPESTLFGFGQADGGALLLSYTAEDKKELAALDLETGGLTGLYDWTLLGGVVSADWISQWDQGYVFYSCGGDKIEQLRWASGDRPERITLQMAVTGNNNISQLVQGFNFSQDVYTIEITTYNDTKDGKPLDLLRTELLTGNAPDLYCFCSGGSVSSVDTGGVDPAKFGMDLLPWLDGDSEFDREDFVPNLLAGMERGGGLYTLPLAFIIVTCVAPEELVAEPGITIEELEAVRERAGDGWVTFDSWNDASNLLGLTMPFCLGAYLDRDTGTCSFDSQEFQDYLTWCKTWAGGGVTVVNEVVSGYDPDEKPILSMRYVASSREVVSLASSVQYRGYSGYTYAGIPVEEGMGSVFETCTELGISAATAYPEGAWSFLHYCLTRQSDITELIYGLPVLQPVIDSQVAWYQSGEAVGYDGSPEIAEQKNVDRFYELLNNTTVMGGEDTVLEEIIKAEAELFFSGDRTAAETASIIQNRASLYVMEQYG